MASPARSGLVLWTIACYHGWNFHLIAFKWGWAWTTHEQVPSFEYRPSVMVIKINANGWVPSPPPKKEKMPLFFLIYIGLCFSLSSCMWLEQITLWTQTTSSTCKMHVSHYSLFSYFFTILSFSWSVAWLFWPLKKLEKVEEKIVLVEKEEEIISHPQSFHVVG